MRASAEFKARKNLVSIVCDSLFLSGLVILLAACICVGAIKLFDLNGETFKVALPLNSTLLLVCAGLALTAIARQYKWLFHVSYGVMLVLLLLSSPLVADESLMHFSMPLLQLLSWGFVFFSLIGSYKRRSVVWKRIGQLGFVVLAVFMLALLFEDSGMLAGQAFGASPSASLNTAIFMLFIAIAGLTVPTELRVKCNLGNSLALCLGVVTAVVWLSFMHELQQGNHEITKETVLKFEQRTEQILEEQKALIQRMGERVSAAEIAYLATQIELDLKTYLRDYPYLDYIALLDNAGVVRYSLGQTYAIRQEHDGHSNADHGLLATNNATDKVRLHYNKNEGNSYVRVILDQPNEAGLSDIIAGINLQSVMQFTLPAIVPMGYGVTLAYENSPELLFSQFEPGQEYFQLGEYGISPSKGTDWTLQLYRDYEIERNYIRQVSEIILLAGWLVCLLTLIAQQYKTGLQRQQKRLLVGNKKLKQSLEMQRKLQEEHLLFKANSSDLLCIIDVDGRFLEVSNASNWLLGYTESELNGQLLFDLVHPDERAESERVFATLKDSTETHNIKRRLIHKDGHMVHLLWSVRYAETNRKLYAVAKDIGELVKVECYQQAQQDILQLIAVEAPIENILKQICLMAETHNTSVKACVMLKVEHHLQIVSAPSLSQAYHSALAQISIADNTGSCGTSAFRKKLVISTDISTDLKWSHIADSVLAEGLYSCWSIPLTIDNENVLGTFALYGDSAREPTKEERELLTSCARLATNAIDRAQQKRLLTESEQRFHSFYDYNPDIVYVINAKGYFVDVNEAGSALLEWPESKLRRLHVNRIVVSEKKAAVAEYFGRVLAGNAQSFETSLISRTGKRHEVQITVMPSWVDGKIVGAIGIAKDITQRLSIEKELRLFKRAVDASSNGIMITDHTKHDMPISYVNMGFEKITGYSYAEAVGRNPRFLQGKDRDETVLGRIRTAIEAKKEVRVSLKNFRKDGRILWNNLLLSPVPNELGEVTHYIGVQSDITEQKKYEQELAFTSSHDLLTGLPNRNLLQDRLTQSIKTSVLRQLKVGVIFINLDGFKLINDSLGHLVGDEVIRQVSARIKNQIDPTDTLARMGGDEFVVQIADIKDESDLTPLIEDILSAISSPMEVDGKELQVTASIGVSLAGDDMSQPMDFVKQADLAMSQAKRLGGNTAQNYHPDMEKTLNHKLSLRAMLQQAVENKEFELYYQPQVKAGTGRLIGLEALIRWNQPEIGLIGPDEFIPLAEEMGLINEIGQWVIEEAANYNRSLQERGLIELVIAVNLSAMQFKTLGFVKQLGETLAKVQLEPKWFELELTESLVLDNIEQVVDKLQRLKKLGVKIAIDDFGTGYSSLNYLKRLPIDKLKIDKSFVNDLVTDDKDAAIIRAIIAMAHQLGVKVIAEGIETAAQATLLDRYLCDELQGYFYSRPLPAEQLEKFFQHYLPTQTVDANSTQETLLLVDDEENILHSLKRMLRKEPFHILTCTSAAEAFELLALHNVQVIVSDQRMPGMSGTEFFSQVKKMHPNTVRLILSGYTDLHSVKDAINRGSIYKFITKPWQDDSLIKEIKDAFRLYKERHDIRS